MSEQSSVPTSKSFTLEEIFSIKPEPTLVDSQSDSVPSLSSYELNNQSPASARIGEHLDIDNSKFDFNDEYLAEEYNLYVTESHRCGTKAI